MQCNPRGRRLRAQPTSSDRYNGTWNYTYDTLNRLTGSVAGSNVPTPLAGLYGCWTYDGFGNRTLEAYSTASSTPCAAGANANAQYTATPQSAAANNRLASTLATYDGAGNVIADSRNAYLYDPEGRLCAVETNLAGTPAFTQYLYDAEGRRVAKGSGTSLSCNAPTAANGFALTSQYLLDQAGEQASELTGAGTWLHSNVWQGGRLTGTYDARGLHFALSDPLGTKRVQATVTAAGLGAPELNFLTLPYGNNLGNTLTTDAVPVGAGGTDATEHHFTGKERDTESGNDYFEARYYGSSMGRFMSPDDGTDQDPTHPQSWNLYSYVRNNPLGSVDADGHQVTVCSNVTNADGSTGQTCNTISDDAYKAAVAAQQAANANNPPYSGVQAPGGDHPNGNITDNGQVVGTATWSANPTPASGAAIPGDMGLSFVAGGMATDFVVGKIAGAIGSMLGRGAGDVAEAAAAAPKIVAADGTEITGYTAHGLDRAIGDGAAGTPGVRAGTSPQAILDALKNPQSIKSGIDQLGRPYKTFIGQDAKVVVNPSSGKIVSVNPLSGAGAR